MSSSGKTPNIELSQYADQDIPSFDDHNADNLIVDKLISDLSQYPIINAISPGPGLILIYGSYFGLSANRCAFVEFAIRKPAGTEMPATIFSIPAEYAPANSRVFPAIVTNMSTSQIVDMACGIYVPAGSGASSVAVAYRSPALDVSNEYRVFASFSYISV